MLETAHTTKNWPRGPSLRELTIEGKTQREKTGEEKGLRWPGGEVCLLAFTYALYFICGT